MPRLSMTGYQAIYGDDAEVRAIESDCISIVGECLGIDVVQWATCDDKDLVAVIFDAGTELLAEQIGRAHV